MATSVFLMAISCVATAPVDRAKAEIDASDDLTMLERQEFASKVTEQWGNIEWERNSLLVNQTREDRLRLVSEELSYQMVLDEHFKHLDPTERIGGIESLAFITPWNDFGYTMSQKFHNKFDYLCPVWFELKLALRSGKLSMALRGKHFINDEWASNLTAKVHPRVLIDIDAKHSFKIWKQVISNAKIQDAVLEKLLKLCKDRSYSGLTIELWLAWYTLGTSGSTDAQKLRDNLNIFVKRLGAAFSSADLKLLLVVPPERSKGYFGATDLKSIATSVHKIIVMTTDFSMGQPGPSAPLGWQMRAIEKLCDDDEIREKMMLTVAFEGHHLRGKQTSELPGKKFIELLSKFKPNVKWDSKSEEHVAIYRTNGVKNLLNYPSLLSLTRRIAAARQLGVGLAVWGVGQGLNYFFDLL